MKELFEKIKLIQKTSFEIQIQKNDFVKIFKDNIDYGDIGNFSGLTEAFTSSKNQYKGRVDFNGFYIRKRKQLFDMNHSFAVAQGTFQQKGDILQVDTEIRGVNNRLTFFFVFALIFYLVMISSFFFGTSNEDEFPFFIIPFLIIHATLMIGIPYFIIRRGIKRMKYDLERDFIYWVKK